MKMSVSSSNKVSGLKPPSKIARPTNIHVERNSEISTTAGDGINSTVRKLSKDAANKKSINDDSYSNWEGLKFDQSFARRESDASSMLTEDTDSFIVGDRVWVGGNKPGVIAFIGETQFGPGDWAGVVLDEHIGKNDGSVAGIRYFQCPPNRGIFSRLSRLSRYPIDPNQLSSRLLKTPTPVTPDRKPTATSSPTSSISSKIQLPYSYNHFPSSNGADIKVGDRVIVQSSHGSKAGVLSYYGNTEFGTGLWCGVELDDPLGKNDGSVAGVRYFSCAPKFGLFVPAEKVSKSPISNKKASCVVHPDGLTRQGTLDSIRSTSTINTSISSIKSNSRKPTPRSSVTPSRTSTTQAPKSPLQEQLKEKDTYIKQLLKERELERAEIIRAATQAEEVEKKLAALKNDYNKACSELELQKTSYSQTIEKLEKEKFRLESHLDEERRKIEDLQFNYEEESITKSEIQALNEEYVEKLKNFEKVVNSAHASLEYEGHSSGIFDNATSSTNEAAAASDVGKNLAEELSNSKILILTLTDKKSELENECATLKETIEKLKVIEQNKDEVITLLKKEANTYQQLDVGSKGETVALKNEITVLKEKLETTEKESEISKKEIFSLKEKLIGLETAVKQKDEEIRKKSESLNAKEQELRNEMENAGNNLQFELDEYKIKAEELTKKISQLSDDIESSENKRKNYLGISIHCLTQLSNDLKNECELITKVILGNETATNVISTLRSKDTTLSSLIEKCPEEFKDSVLELSQQMEQITHNNAMLLEKIETLTEVISRKDSQIEEITEEKENLRKEYLESIESKTSELKNLESKYADLNLVKNDIESQLKASEENIRKMEAMCSNMDQVTSEMENVRKHLEEKSVTCEKLLQDAKALKEELKTKDEENRLTRENLEKEKEKLKLEIDNISEKLKNEIDEKTNLRKDYNELQKLNEVTKTMNEAKNTNEFDTLQNKIEQLITENQNKEEQLREMENRCKEFQEKESNLQKEMSRMETSLKNISEKVQEFKKLTNGKISSAVAQNDIEAHLDNMCSYLKELQNEYNNFQTSYKNLENSKTALEEQLNNVKNESTQTKDKLDTISVERNDLEKQMKEYSSENKSLNEKLLQCEREMSEISQKYAGIKSECDEKVKEFEEIQRKKDSLESANQSLIKDAETLKSEFNNLKQNMQNKEQQMNAEKNEMEQNFKTLENSKDEFIQKVKQYAEMNNEIPILRNKIESLNQELSKTNAEKIEMEQKLKNLENANDKFTEKVKQYEEMNSEIPTLREKVEFLNIELSKISVEKIAMEQNLKTLENVNDQFTEKVEQYTEMNSEIALLREKVISLNEELSNNEKKYHFEIAESKKNIQDLLLEKENLSSECKAVKSQLESLKEELVKVKNNLDNTNRNMNGLIADESKLTNGGLKVELLEERNARNKLETELKNALSNDNVFNNNNVINSQDDKYIKLLEAKESAEGQVNFLNSVIVDMQRKNENLLERIQYLENKDPSEALECRKPKFVAPRLFCDICDVFDLHETEDCPRQSNSSPPPIHRDSPKVKPPPRPYCEHCEMFGHDTSNCSVEENY